MEILHFLEVFFLGILEGVSEFLPISSTGHLILFIDFLNFKAPEGKVFEVVIQLGAILAICTVFRSRVTDVLFHFHKKRETRYFVFLLVMAFLPAAIIGVFAHKTIKEVLFSPEVVAIMLVVGGILILLIEKIKPQPIIHSVDDITVKKAVAIGFCQALAMIPGTSRSGATMMGSLMMGIDRKTAAEFSFLLAIPTMASATAYDLYKNFHHLTLDDGITIGLGFLAAFLSSLLTVKWLLGFLSKHGFAVFAYYRIVFGSILLAMIYA